MINGNTLIFVGFLAALLAGCDNKPAAHVMPEVNDSNCQMETINKIQDKATREEFAGLCSRRPTGITPTENPKNWLDLTDPEQE